MNQTLDTHRKPNDRCTCCVSCSEILSNPVFSKRISREFCGWGKVLDWKDTVVEQARDNMTTIHNHMWDSQIIQDALLPTSNNEGESEVGGNGRPKRKGKTPDGEREEVPDRSKKKKVKGKGSRRREKDDDDVIFLYGYIGDRMNELAAVKTLLSALEAPSLLRSVACPTRRLPASFEAHQPLPEVNLESSLVPINLGQREVLNSLRYDIEFIQGPPGTGKKSTAT